MMNSGRLFRAALTGIVLFVCVWALKELDARRAMSTSVPTQKPLEETVEPAADEANTVPAVRVETFPLVAMDNTCFDSDIRDLSKCTGLLSGAPSREYRLTAGENWTLHIEGIPRSEFFDLSVGLYSTDERCIAGFDNHGPGSPEAAVISDLEAGEYVLVVGGYEGDCGPYELTVRLEAPEIAQVVEARIHQGANGRIVFWNTFAEVDLDYFILYRTSGEERKRVAFLRGRGSPAGFARYRVLDRLARPDTSYEIEAVARDGRKESVSITI